MKIVRPRLFTGSITLMTPVHSLWRAQRHGTSCRRTYGH